MLETEAIKVRESLEQYFISLNGNLSQFSHQPLQVEDKLAVLTLPWLQSFGEWLGLPKDDLLTAFDAVKSITFRIFSRNIAAACDHVRQHLSRLTTDAAIGWIKREVSIRGIALDPIAKHFGVEATPQAIAEYCTRRNNVEAIADVNSKKSFHPDPLISQAIASIKSFWNKLLPDVKIEWRAYKKVWGMAYLSQGKIGLSEELKTAPSFALMYVLWHEYCHFLAPPFHDGERWQKHHAEFKIFEHKCGVVNKFNQWALANANIPSSFSLRVSDPALKKAVELIKSFWDKPLPCVEIRWEHTSSKRWIVRTRGDVIEVNPHFIKPSDVHTLTYYIWQQICHFIKKPIIVDGRRIWKHKEWKALASLCPIKPSVF